MNNTTIIIIAAIVVIALALLFLVRGRKQRVTFSDSPTQLTRTAAPAAKPIVTPEPEPIVPAPTSAPIVERAEPVEPQPEAIEPGPEPASPRDTTAKADAADPLTQIKGLGPKASAMLAGLGVTRFAQIAAWSDADVARIDAEMGAFKGRIVRDRWIDQARLLAKGDVQGFEAEFGKLGG